MMWNESVEAANLLRERTSANPTLGLILGSGLGSFAERLENQRIVKYEDIPHFPTSSVAGHAGQLVFGELHGVSIVAMQGRVHGYEGWTPRQVVFPVRVMWQLGVRRLIVTNAAGGVRPEFLPGDLVLISDHLNLTGANPLTGDNDDRFGPRFPAQGDTWTEALRAIARKVAAARGVRLQEGVYAGMAGPTYESPAEVRMVHRVGGDLVGMSTVYEAIAARHMDMELLGISCVTNRAAGLPGAILDHNDVQEVAKRVRATFMKLVDGVIEEMARA